MSAQKLRDFYLAFKRQIFGKRHRNKFYGLKVYLVCNEKGELLSFYLTKGNVDDSNIRPIKNMTEQLFGKLFTNKGYLSKTLWKMLFKYEIQLFTKLRKNIKNYIMKMEDKILLRKKSIIETINNELKTTVK
ncbi:transposase [Chryseobacterium sp. CBTAP 102]|uniref:transposase n=1 Tax=Chryseobacterium sp. CBTAP 102 TaxID=2135644 RepID=UPI0029372508|nr:transposase [Chryseobacterium sp. CBTAP 102]